MATDNNQDTVYSTRSLSKWFAIGSILLTITIVWASIQEYARPWKGYQRQAQRIVTAINERKLAEADIAMDKSKLEGIENEIAEVQEELDQVVKEINAKLEDVEAKLYVATKNYQEAKGIHDENHFHLEVAIKNRDPSLKSKLEAYEEEAKEVERLFKIQEQATLARDAVLADKNDILSTEKDAQSRLAALNRSRDGILKIIKNNEVNLFNVVRNAPVIDFVAPTIKVHQVILNGLYDDYFFNKVPRVDRCMTCHVNANKAGFEDFPQPFTSHSKLHLIAGPDSPHPVERFGCTGCHAGVPQAITFTGSAHAPSTPAEEAEWKEKYGFYMSTHVKTHMVPVEMTEGKCIQCHAKEVILEDAPTFNAGMRLIEQYGCYGCHKFAGHFEELAKEKKSGPSLTMVASKVDAEWIKKWLWDPKSYRPSTLMPAFWQLHNNSDPDSLARGKVEVEAITHYLVEKSKPYEPIQLASEVIGNSTRGKELVEQVGCLGCHAIADVAVERPSEPSELGYKNPLLPMFGPELNQMGSKVDKDWLVSWLIAPKHYWEGTSMPSMKLTEQEAVDIAEYLLEKRNEEFDGMMAPVADSDVRDAITLEFLEGQMHSEAAEVKLASMSLDEKKMYLGDKMISHYGCYACHAIEGFENAPNLGAELTYQGSKEVTKFAFDNVKINKASREQWIYTKIRTPRIFDVGKKRDFQAKTRMPHFGFNQEQANAIASIVIGYELDKVDDSMKAPVDGRKEQIIAGHRLINRKNCIGCHAVESPELNERAIQGGRILAHYDDNAEGPPILYTQGDKTQAEWLFAYFKNPDVMIRPWLNVRMPQFNLSDQEARTLIKYFAAVDNAPYPFSSRHSSILSASDLAQAKGLVEELGCMTCHGIRKDGEPVADAAPHFQNIKARLNGEWILPWLANPNAMMPGTRMPALWPSEDPTDENSPLMGIPGYFDDDAERQIQAVRDYLYIWEGEPTLPSPPNATPVNGYSVSGMADGSAEAGSR